MDLQIRKLIKEFESAFLDEKLAKITFSKPRNKISDLLNVYIRPVEIKSERVLSFVYHYKNKDLTKNLNLQEAKFAMNDLFKYKTFLQTNLFTTSGDFELRISRSNEAQILEKAASITEIQEYHHDRQKKRWVDTKNNTYLQELGILDKNFQVIPSMADKFKQIQKYVEIFDGLLNKLGNRKELNIADMGSGKGYLSFSLYDYLLNSKDVNVKMTGIEQRKELVKSCNDIARKSLFRTLRFKTGNINDFEDEEVDVLIALHACDTATDEAIYKGISMNADLILCAPCCHKQLRKEMHADKSVNPMIKYGILEERQAEILTDTIRALILNKYGYETNVFEFISSEHTAKNLMISAVKTKMKFDLDEIDKEIENMKKQFGIEKHYLEEITNSKK